MHPVAESRSVFRRSFLLDRVPIRATLTIRALKRYEVALNGVTADVSTPPKPNWKDVTELDVAGMLRPGTNQIAVTVLNRDGPQALWLSLEAGSFKLYSDRDWEVSLEGSGWHNVRLASNPPHIEKDNPLFSKETAVGCFVRRLPLLLFFAALATGIVLGGSWWLKRYRRHGEPHGPVDSTKFAMLVLVGMAVCWIALFANNLGRLPILFGFDVDDHLEYINFIKTHHSLPLANQGREMYNPPLYYATCAALAAVLKLDVSSVEATQVFRGFGLVVGIAQFTLIFLCLRLLFPAQWRMQFFGLTLAAFLPEHLYMSQYVTNESLAALWVTAALYLCLRLLKGNRPCWWLSITAGACLGAAVLTKVTAIIAVPFIMGALLGWLMLQRIRAVRIWFTTVGLFLAATLAVCGWHYLRAWKTFGTPFGFPGFDATSGFAFWAEDGLSTTAYFTRFGQCLTHPFFSAFHGFADGVYSTFWGDGSCGGSVSFISRPPWDYELMAASMLLALLPTAVILIGLGACLSRFFRRPGPIWFLLLGIPLASFAGLVYINLKVPCTNVVKAFYCMIALFPICAFGSVGWDILYRHARGFRLVLCVVFGVWALNAYASYWIRGETCATHSVRGLDYFQNNRYEDAVREFSAALTMEPDDVGAHVNLGNALAAQGRVNEAVQQYERALQGSPNDATAHNNLGMALAEQGKLEEAVRHYEQALEWKPDFAAAHGGLGNALAAQGKLDEAISHYERALQLNPDDATIHTNLGIALARQGKLTEAIEHWQQALHLDPESASAHYNLGNALFMQGKWTDAIQHYERTLQLRPDDANAHNAIGRALVKQGKSAEALPYFQQALSLATAQNQAALAETIRTRLKALQSAQPHPPAP